MMGKYRYDIGFVTDPGNVRSENQDSLIIRCGSMEQTDFALVAVADGMGGLAHGAEASTRAVQTLDQWWNEQLSDLLADGYDAAKLKNSLMVAVDRINYAIFADANAGGEKNGTTLTLAFLYQRQYLLMQVGDSRAYLLRGGKLRQLTKDQTWCRAEIDAGRLTEEKAATHPMRHVLISAIGVAEHYMLETQTGKLAPGEGLLLCSDGFYGEMNPDCFRLEEKDASAQTMLDAAAQQLRLGAAEDNLTGVLLRLERTRGWL